MGVNQRAQIVMSDTEVTEFLERSRIATLATLGPTGTPHLTAMWFALIGGVKLRTIDFTGVADGGIAWGALCGA